MTFASKGFTTEVIFKWFDRQKSREIKFKNKIYMKLVTYNNIKSDPRIGVIIENSVYDAVEVVAAYEQEKKKFESNLPSDAIGLLNLGDNALGRLDEASKSFHAEGRDKGLNGNNLAYPLETIKLLAPVPRPGKVIGIARNYPDMAAHEGAPIDKYPYMFSKPVTSMNGPDHPIYCPRRFNKAVSEVELGFVVGKRGRYIPADKAYDYILGYTVFNDLGMFGWMDDPEEGEPPRMDWLYGKWFDTFSCMGPAMVTKNEIPYPLNLDFRTRLNGKVLSEGNTSRMHFKIPELVEYISSFMTLEPGDVVATGTVTADVLKPGDILESIIDKVGILRNPVEVEPDEVGVS